jgi:hypothetical protein
VRARFKGVKISGAVDADAKCVIQIKAETITDNKVRCLHWQKTTTRTLLKVSQNCNRLFGSFFDLADDSMADLDLA